MMNLSAAEVLALLTTGYVSGLSISAGFILSAVFRLYVKNATGGWKGVVWIVVFVINMISGTLAPIFMIAVLVFANDPHGPLFWWRMLIFTSGVLGGSAFSFICAWLFERARRDGTLLAFLQHRRRDEDREQS